jgi:secreted trypsin-like serine protease
VCEDGGSWFLHGAVSFGLRNCPTTHYTVFARVASFVDWIERNTGMYFVFIYFQYRYVVHARNPL